MLLSRQDKGVACELLLMLNHAYQKKKIDVKSFKLQSFHKSHLRKLRVAPSETAMTDVLREVYFLQYFSFG